MKSLLLLACVLVTSEVARGQASELNDLVVSMNLLREAVDASAKEQWSALQSLRFHLMSTRTGLKQALQDIGSLKADLNRCNKMNARDIGTTPVGPTDGPPYPTHAPGTISPPTPAPCQWPGEKVGRRCIVVVTDEVLSWSAAQAYCRNELQGRLIGPHDMDEVRARLVELFGFEEGNRARWSMWSGARQSFLGWSWTDDSCQNRNFTTSIWSNNEPHPLSSLEDVVPYCLALDGFSDYLGKAVPCSALRRFVCDVTQD